MPPRRPLRLRVLRGLGIAALVACVLAGVEERARTFSVPTETRAAVSSADPGAVGRAVAEILDRAHDAAAFEGCALVSMHGRVVAEPCTGSLGPTSRFSIASLSKQFTGLLVHELVRAGNVSLDERIDAYVSELSGSPAGTVTVAQLLHMTSGLPDTIDLPTTVATQLSSTPRTVQDFLSKVRGYPLAFEPGTRAQYSNVGYGVLAVLIERVNGRPWRDVLRERFAREVMSDTGFMEPRASDAAGVVPGHVPLRCALVAGRVCARETPRWNYSLLLGGGVYSSVRDLFAWDRALRRMETQSPELYRAFIEPSPWAYASGWYVSTHALADGREVPLLEYSGEDPGYASRFVRLPHLDAAIIVLSSTDFTLTRSNVDVFTAVERVVLGEPYDVVKT
jgi:CubicO group peptidase (beta-lactamase class C family)